MIGPKTGEAYIWFSGQARSKPVQLFWWWQSCI